MIVRKPLLLLSAILSLPLIAAAAIKPSSIKTAKDGDTTYFRLQIALPSDAADDVSVTPWMPNQSVRFPQMFSSPMSDAPCFLMTRQQGQWSPITGRDVFYGKTRKSGPLSLKLLYPKAKGGWGEETVDVDLAAAVELKKESISTDDSATSSPELTPAQQFASAQAGWFGLLDVQIPDDAGFLSYARLQTLRMAGLPTLDIRDPMGTDPEMRRQRLYETATGARAIQETLQLDRMLRNASTTETRTVDISSVEGIQTKSHPFDEMMKGKQPKFSDLAKLVPADQYMLRFTSVAKLQELADFAQQWGHSILESPEVGGADAGLRARFQKQICLPSSLLSRLLGPAIVKELAVTGSDPFFREGTDITIIFETVSADIFKGAVDTYWKTALAENPTADRKTIASGSVAIEKIVTPDRTVSAFRVFLDNTAIYSNSITALNRILETKAKPESSLASAPDFKYMRAVWPQSEADEDGFLYLSDPFIRRLVGPEMKIKSQRRVEAYGTMRMLQNAAMLHGFMNGPGKTPTLDEMIGGKLIAKSDLVTPDGDLKWDAPTASVSNTVYGKPGFLTPLCELPISKITQTESREYESFRDRYQQYWRRFFDPIGVRIKVGKTISTEAYILPLIDETHYQDLKRLSGEKPGKFDLGRISTGTLVRWQVRLDPEAREVREGRQMAGSMFGKDAAFTNWIGQWFAAWIEEGDYSSEALRSFLDYEFRDDEETEPLPSSRSRGLSHFFEMPIAIGVEVKNKLSLAAFLVALQGMVKTAAPDLVTFVPRDPYKGLTFVKVAPKPDGQIARELAREVGDAAIEETTPGSPPPAKIPMPDIGLYYGNIGDAWYLSTKQAILERLTDAMEMSAKAGKSSREIDYNAYLVVSPANSVQSRPAIDKAASVLARRAERMKLRQAWLLWRCGLVPSADGLTSAAQTWLGGELTLPSGGKISYDPASDQAVSSAYGPMRQFESADRTKAPNPLLQLFDSIAHARAWLQFTEDGLMTHLELERK